MGCASSTDAASGKGSTREEDDVFEVRLLLLLHTRLLHLVLGVVCDSCGACCCCCCSVCLECLVCLVRIVSRCCYYWSPEAL
jgi:hypothetical protein